MFLIRSFGAVVILALVMSCQGNSPRISIKYVRGSVQPTNAAAYNSYVNIAAKETEVNHTSNSSGDHKGITQPIWGDYRVSSRYGYRIDPIYRRQKLHKGIDLACKRNTPVRVVGCGRVLEAGYSSSYGYYVKVNHGNGYSTLYGHLKSYSVHKGQDVHKGNIIGKVGSSGNATGNHLHFELRKNNVCQNPDKYFKF